MTALLRRREAGIALALLVVIGVTTAIQPGFLLSPGGWRDLLLTPAILVVLAVGQAVVVITRNVDLSVGSMLGLTAYLTGRLFIEAPDLPVVVVALVAVAAGAALGLVNGSIVAFARVPRARNARGRCWASRC